MTVKYFPIDLPKNLYNIIENVNDDLKKEINQITEEALTNDRWLEPKALPLDSANLEFAAYLLHKSDTPIIKPWEGTQMDVHFSRFRKTEFRFKSPEFIKSKSYKLNIAGDLMFAKYLKESKDILYKHVESLIFDAELTYANLESTLHLHEAKTFSVNDAGETPYVSISVDEYETLTKHKDNRYQVLQIANNHIMDYGERGAMATLSQLKKDGIQHLGVYETEAESEEILTTQLGDVKIGWLAHTYSLNDKPLPEGKPWMCDVTAFHDASKLDLNRIKKQISQARDNGCDLIVLGLHWGLEYELYPHPNQQKWAYEFAELGVDLIIGHHPHIIQPFEIYNPSYDSSKSVPIFYSLGNLTPSFSAPSTVLSLVGSLEVVVGQEKGQKKVAITKATITPVAFMMGVVNQMRYASLLPLKQLNQLELDEETRTYVDEINKYADIVLGEKWRD